MLREAVPLGRFLDLGAMFALWKFGSDRQCLFRNRHIVEVATRASELVGFVFTRRFDRLAFTVTPWPTDRGIHSFNDVALCFARYACNSVL